MLQYVSCINADIVIIMLKVSISLLAAGTRGMVRAADRPFGAGFSTVTSANFHMPVSFPMHIRNDSLLVCVLFMVYFDAPALVRFLQIMREERWKIVVPATFVNPTICPGCYCVHRFNYLHHRHCEDDSLAQKVSPENE